MSRPPDPTAPRPPSPLGFDPFAPLRPLVEGVGGVDQADRVRRGMLVHQAVPRPPVGLTPHTVIHAQNKLVVRYYPPSGAVRKTPVVVVPSMINRAYICDLEPDRSLVGALARAGHPTYLVDWGVPGEEDAKTTVADVVLDLLHRAVDRVCRHAKSPTASLLGYCQGGTLATIYAALRPRRVATLAVFNAPVRFSAGGRFRDFVDPAAFDVDEAIDKERLLPIELMRVAFKLLDPMGNWNKYIAIEQDAQDPQRLARTMARERWLEENVPMPGTFAAEFIRNAYQEDRLLAGTWEIGGERVDLRQITVPLLVLAAAKDFITPAEAALPLAEATGSADVTSEVLASGHIGVVVGGFGPKVFYPLLSRWHQARTP
jgi:polyhydroxyalkanoate synthase